MSRNPLYFWLWLLYKKECRKYYNDLDLSRITDHEKFRKPLNLYYPIKGKTTLIDKDGKSNSRLHSNSWYTRYLFRNSGQLTCSLEINENRFILTETATITDPVEKPTEKYEHHTTIKENVHIWTLFKFSNLSSKDCKKHLESE